jgi:ABC-type transport system substrate-binding protein
MSKHYRLVLGFISILAVFGLVACRRSAGESPAGTPNVPASAAGAGSGEKPLGNVNRIKTDETLVVAMPSEPNALSPLNGSNSHMDNNIQVHIGSRLFELNTNKDLEYSLAASYETIDETHYRIRLRDGLCFSDGTPLTAADVAYTFTLAKEETNLTWCEKFDPAGFVVEDEKTVVIAYTQYAPGFPSDLGESAAWIASKKSLEAMDRAAMNRTPPAGSGRYKFVEWKSGEYILLERNENYWDSDYTGYYKYLKFIFISDAASRTLAVRSGDADVGMELTLSEAKALENDPAVKPVIFQSGNTRNLYFNTSKGIFTDPKLREACMYLVNSQAIAEITNAGYGKVVQGFIPESNPYYKEYYPNGQHPMDVAKAKQLLAEAGYPNGFSCKAVILPTFEQLAVIVQENFRQANINMEITILEPARAVGEFRAGNYEIAIGQNDNSIVHLENFNLIDPETAWTTIGGPKITDPAMIPILKKARSSDKALEKEGWIEVIDYIFDNVCLVGLCDDYYCFTIDAGLNGLRLRKRYYIDVSDVVPNT